MRVERIVEFDRFLSLREDWNAFLFSSDLNSIFLTHEWFSAWWRHLSESSELQILIFRNHADCISGVAPLRIKDNKVLFMASHEVSDYCDFITPNKMGEAFHRVFLKKLQMDYPNTFHFEFINIKESSPTLLHIPRLASEYGFMYTRIESDAVPALDLPSTYEAYIAGLNRKNRHELRRKLRRIEALKGMKVKKITKPADLKPAINTFIGLHSAGSKGKNRFWSTKGMENFFREIISQFARKGWVELNCMFLQNSLMAALIKFSYGNEILFYNIAYSTDFARFSPGLHLFCSSIQEAIAAKKKRADFLRGREKYKYDFGAKECRIYNLSLKRSERET